MVGISTRPTESNSRGSALITEAAGKEGLRGELPAAIHCVRPLTPFGSPLRPGQTSPVAGG